MQNLMFATEGTENREGNLNKEKSRSSYKTSFLSAFLCALCVLCGKGFAQAADIRTLTLDQALSIAMEKNRDIEKAREYARYVQGKYLEERAAALPQLALNGSVSLARDESQATLYGASNHQYSRILDVTLSQPLYTWGKIGAAIRAAKAGMKTADEQLRLYRQAANRDVTAAFYDILLFKKLHLVALENLEQKKRHLYEAKSRFAAGVATDYDVLAAEVAAENAGPDVIRSEHSVTSARERLRFLLAIENHEVDVAGVLETPVIPVQSYDEALKAARLKRPELADLRYRILIYRELITIADAENKPRLDLKGGAGWRWLDVRDTNMNSGSNGAAWNAGIYLSFPFFDGFKTSGKVAQAQSDLRTQQIEEAKLIDSIALEIRNSGNAVKEATDILTALGGTVRQAERLLQMAEIGFELGVKIRLEVDDAQLNLSQARNNLARAQRDYRVALVNYQWAMGVAGE